jgi:hypothetical protein
MNRYVQDKLCQIAARYGPAIAGDPRRCRNLLRDLCPTDPREVHVLVEALAERVPADLLDGWKGQVAASCLRRLTKRLEDNRALAPDAARWAVESWALALQLLSPQQIETLRLKPAAPLVPPPVVQPPIAQPPRVILRTTVNRRRRLVAVGGIALVAASVLAVATTWHPSTRAQVEQPRQAVSAKQAAASQDSTDVVSAIQGDRNATEDVPVSTRTATESVPYSAITAEEAAMVRGVLEE